MVGVERQRKTYAVVCRMVLSLFRYAIICYSDPDAEGYAIPISQGRGLSGSAAVIEERRADRHNVECVWDGWIKRTPECS